MNVAIVLAGEIDGAHMLAGQPIASTIGYGTKGAIVTPFSMDLNGNGITVSNAVWEAMKPNVPLRSWAPKSSFSIAAIIRCVRRRRCSTAPSTSIVI